VISEKEETKDKDSTLIKVYESNIDKKTIERTDE